MQFSLVLLTVVNKEKVTVFLSPFILSFPTMIIPIPHVWVSANCCTTFMPPTTPPVG